MMTATATSNNLQHAEIEVGGALLWTALAGASFACAMPLAQGLLGGWSWERALIYVLFAIPFISFSQVNRLPEPLCSALTSRLDRYLAIMGALCLALQTISADPFFQPIAVCVPFVYAVLRYRALQAAFVGALLLAVAMLGMWLGGVRDLAAYIGSLLAYALVMVMLFTLVRISIEQAAARRRADELGVALAQERDYLARLVAITATLARELDPAPVLAMVAREGRALAHAGSAYVWLYEEERQTPQLAAVDPAADPAAAPPAPDAAPGPGESGSVLVLPLIFDERRIGALVLRDPAEGRFADEDVRRLQPLADAAAVAIENARLFAQARLTATMAERNRLARELHDTIAQGLTAVAMQIEAAQRGLDRDGERARARLTRAHELARATLDDVRRSVWTLAEPLVDGAALGVTLAELVQRFGERTGVAAAYRSSGPPPPLDAAAASQIVRMVQEALQNVEKHANAAYVTVELHTDNNSIQITVLDDGVGFDPARAHNGGFGLTGLRERARLAGATLTIESAPGGGTRMMIDMPQ
jgi:signal transduction histidine kinase